MTEFTGPLGTMLGTYYPKHFVVAVIHERSAAEEAVEALKDAGFDDEAVQLHTSQQVLDNHRAFQERRGLLQRVESLFPSEEADAVKDYLEEAEQGRSFITVHAPEPEPRARARDILKAHGGHHMRYYGDATITDLD